MVATQVSCVYFALCDRPADGVVELGILDPVPTCQRCADKVGATLVHGTFVVAEDGLSAMFTPSEVTATATAPGGAGGSGVGA